MRCCTTHDFERIQNLASRSRAAEWLDWIHQTDRRTAHCCLGKLPTCPRCFTCVGTAAMNDPQLARDVNPPTLPTGPRMATATGRAILARSTEAGLLVTSGMAAGT